MAARAAATCALLTGTGQLHAQGGIFDPYIPQALPLGHSGQNYQHRAPQQHYRQPPAQQRAVPAPVNYNRNQTQLQRASYNQPAQRQIAAAIPANSNVWNRVFRTFHLPDYANNYRVKKFIRSYGSNPKQMNTLLTRADPFIHMIIEEINRRGMPAEIALLPFVESGFKLDVFSHAGAAGLWQFIPSTGKIYGLHRGRDFDGRMDPFAATNAALNYLQKLQREFNGDWLKALAAYNCGENCVHRAVRKARAAGKSPSYWNMSLPRETMNYVPRLLAFKEILSKSRQYGIRLPATPNAPKLVQVELNKSVNLRRVAQHAGLPSHLLVRLNPNFRKGVTNPRQSRRITIPRKDMTRVMQVMHRI